MKLFVHSLGAHDVDTVSIGTIASRSGAFIGSPATLRAGFGAIIASAQDADLSALAPVLFADVEVDAGATRPVAEGVTAFTQSPFERDEPTSAWVFENTVTLTESGAVLTTVHRDPSTALAEFHHLVPADVHGHVTVPTDLRPTPDGYAHLVTTAVDAIRRGEADKVVLGRRATGRFSANIDAATVVARLHELEPACTLYAVPIDGGRYVGASPELLVSVHDDVVTARPLAGTVALAREDDATDDGSWLLGSAKNLYEHRVVVEEIVDALRSLCTDVRADDAPSVVRLRSVAHLGTWIHAKLDPTSDRPAISLLSALHPTPAVGGRPRSVATDLIARLEGEPRQQFAGAVGWMDTLGNGEWWLAIRGLTIKGPRYVAWAGAGVVADSDPVAEREETRAKLDTILVGLGPLSDGARAGRT